MPPFDCKVTITPELESVCLRFRPSGSDFSMISELAGARPSDLNITPNLSGISPIQTLLSEPHIPRAGMRTYLRNHGANMSACVRAHVYPCVRLSVSST